MRIVATILILYLTPMPTAWGEEIALRIAATSIRAYIASTPQTRVRGLMSVKRLCTNCGMLFIFPRPGRYDFWMKDTPAPLSIAFIDSDGRIVNTDEMAANSLQSHYPAADILYALEMQKGWFKEHGISPGQFLEGLEHAPSGQ